jgi:hypothetical protein
MTNNNTPDLSKLTKAELLALISSGALTTAKPKRAVTAYRVANPEKVSPIGRRTPLAGFDDKHGKGITYASWVDKSAEGVKRFAVRPTDGTKAWLLVDTRGGISKDDIKALAKGFFGVDVPGKVVTGGAGGVDGRPAVAVPCVLFVRKVSGK